MNADELKKLYTAALEATSTPTSTTISEQSIPTRTINNKEINNDNNIPLSIVPKTINYYINNNPTSIDFGI